ncbi:MAG: hypothetical protein ACKPKO_37560, partial [Candidatus Fonsibacter sp.]
MKGHSTDVDVQQGATTAANNRGNDTADSMVHLGALTYGERRKALCQLHDARHAEILKLGWRHSEDADC